MKRQPKAKAPQFDCEPLDEDEEGPCPIPDEHGDVFLKETRRPRKTKKKPKKKPSR